MNLLRGGQHILVIILGFINVSSAPILQKVDDCPNDVSSWTERAKKFQCPNGQKYHCILSIENDLYEICLSPELIPSTADGCPRIGDTDTENPDFALPLTSCPEKLNGCPRKNHVEYNTNELYKYPMCLVPVNERNENRTFEFPSTSTVDSGASSYTPTTQSSIPPESQEEQTAESETIAIILGSLAAFIVIIAIVFIVCFRHSIYQRVQRCRDAHQKIPHTTPEERIPLQSMPPEGGTEWTCRGYLAIMKLKKLLWKYLECQRGQVNFEEFLYEEKVRHSLYHQWRNVICCTCTKSPEIFRKRFLSDKGWKSLYEKQDKTCLGDYKDCSCQYRSRDVEFSDVSISTLLCIVHSVGDLTRNGKRCLAETRHYCEKIFQIQPINATDEDIMQIEALISNFNMNSKHSLTSACNENLGSSLCLTEEVAGKCKQHYEKDVDDLSCLEVNEITEESLSKFTARTEELMQKDVLYVPVPRRETEAMSRLKNDRFLIVAGQAGEGKSTLCRELLREFLNDGNEKAKRLVLKLDQNQVNFLFLHQLGRPCLVYFEDFLGSTQYTKLYSREKTSFYKECIDALQRFPELTVLCCLRSVVLDEAYSDINKIKDPSQYVMDLSMTWRLNRDEMLHSLEQHGKQYSDINLSDTDKDDIIAKASEENFFGFQECCVLCFRARQGKSVFFHPQKEIEREIERLQEEQDIEYFILVYILLSNTPFSIKNMDGELLQNIEGLSVLNRSLRSHVFTFVRKDASNAYTFQHSFIQEAVLKVFGKKDNEKLLMLATDEVVAKFLRPSTYSANTQQEVFLVLDANYDAIFAERLLKAYNYRNVGIHVATQDTQFVSNHLIPALEKNLRVHLRRDSNQKQLLKFVEDTIRHVIQEASRESNTSLLQCFIERYSKLLLDSDTPSENVLNEQNLLIQIAKYFAQYLTRHFGVLPSSLQEQAEHLRKYSNGISEEKPTETEGNT